MHDPPNQKQTPRMVSGGGVGGGWERGRGWEVQVGVSQVDTGPTRGAAHKLCKCPPPCAHVNMIENDVRCPLLLYICM